jgi:hypothetical protein
VLISVPRGTVIPAKPDCAAAQRGGAAGAPPAQASPSGTVGDKIKTWLKNITH